MTENNLNFQKDNTEFVKKYRSEGLNVIPCRVPKGDADRDVAKKPAISWQEYQNKDYEVDIDPKSNIAIICGKISNNLVVVDIDKSDMNLVNEIYPNALKETRVVETGRGGYHVYFRVVTLPKKPLRLNKENGDHIDVQVDGTYVIAPPSIHPNGHEYKIVSETDKIKNIEFQTVVKNLEKAGFKVKQQRDSIQDLAKGGIAKGNRHNSAIRYANLLLLEKGFDPETVRYEMKLWNTTLPESLPQEELDKIINDCIEWCKKQKPYKKKDDGNANNHTELAIRIQTGYNFKTLMENEDVLVYEHGIYVPYGKIKIKEECEILANECYNSLVSEVIGTVQRRTYVQRSEFDNYPTLLNLRNGILDIEKKEVKDHNPEYLFRIQLPINYNPDAKAEKIIKFLNEILEPEYIDWVLDFIAYCLVKNCKQEKAMMLIGEGGNGKSTLLRLLELFLGSDNVSHNSIHELEYDRFAKANLDGKLANMHADINSNEIKKTSILKQLISGDSIEVQKKNQNPYTLKPFAKLIFSANQMPEVNEEREAFFQRWLVVDFVNSFRGTDRENKNLIDEITTDEELSGLLNIVMDRMSKLLSNDGVFKNAPNGSELKQTWKEHANSVESFINNQIVFEQESIIVKNDLYNIYVLFCRKRNFIPLTDKTFSARLKRSMNLVDKIEDTVLKIHGKTVRVWKNVKVKDMPKTSDLDNQQKIDTQDS